MSKNIINTKQNELSAVIRDALVAGLPPLFRIHRSILNRINPEGHDLICSTQELVQTTGYDSNEIEIILKDLSILNFIEYKEEEDGKWRIKAIVY